jgi:hypothetical protein
MVSSSFLELSFLLKQGKELLMAKEGTMINDDQCNGDDVMEKTSLSTPAGSPVPAEWTSPPATGPGTCSGPNTPMDTTLQLEVVARGGRRTRGAALKQIHGMGTRRYVLSADNDNEFRSRCE